MDQPTKFRDHALDMFQSGRIDLALPLLESILDSDPDDWNVRYLIGQAYRLGNQFPTAIRYLQKASEQAPREPWVWLALGIALQLNGELDAATQAFKAAIGLDPDFVEGYNSLGVTFDKGGQHQKAVAAYEAGLEALARQIVKNMRNATQSAIFKHRDTAGDLWLKYAAHASLYLAASADNIDTLAWPTGQSAMEEERTELHQGLYYLDTTSTDGKRVRQLFPNYFNTFRESLRGKVLYVELTLNRGRAFEMLGAIQEANEHYREAEEFEAKP